VYSGGGEAVPPGVNTYPTGSGPKPQKATPYAGVKVDGAPLPGEMLGSEPKVCRPYQGEHEGRHTD
jgi:hypothetical protein